MGFLPMQLDFERDTCHVITPLGPRELPGFPWPSEHRPPFSKLLVDIDRDQLVVGLPTGRLATVELGAQHSSATSALADRVVVYLDQNRWSSMAAWRYGHRRLEAREQAAAARLAELVDRELIVMPLSGGHLVETGPMFGERREAHAATLLEYSRGWQMSNPVRVRAEEISLSVVGSVPSADEVFNLRDDGLFIENLKPVDGSGFPEPFSAAFSRMVNVSSVYAAILERERIPDEGGDAAAGRWAEKLARLGKLAHQDGLSRERVRDLAHEALLHDLLPELARVIPADVLPRWLERAHDQIGRMPYLSRARALLFSRFRNAGTPWEANDLIDINFLCTAAGYADVLAGEKRTIGQLSTARDVSEGGAELTTSLDAAVKAVERRLALRD